MIHSKIIDEETNKNLYTAMEASKNMIYQNDLVVKPLWSREELNK